MRDLGLGLIAHTHAPKELITIALSVYYYVVLQLDSALEEVEELVSTDAFHRCHLFPEWENSFTLAEGRVALREEVEYPDFVPEKACDNSKARPSPNSALNPSIDGGTVWTFQKVDWKHGGHREGCATYESLCLADSGVKLMADNPACGAFLTLFNYSGIPVEIDVHSIVDSPVALVLQEAGTEWADLVARAARSEGRIHLHVVSLLDGWSARLWVVPLRTSSSAIHGRLRVLVARISPEHTKAEISDEIDSVFGDDLDVVEIH
ncbi:hypothetical protein DFH09DRAFT_1344555 [Mycena vulgaris]|nr:hypothetical protein DFH09DRAFT_1344555 [Mycena vulgaris]